MKSRLCSLVKRDRLENISHRRQILADSARWAITFGASVMLPLRLVADEPQPVIKKPTKFLHACMTLVYGEFPLERALTGIKSAGFDYIAWGTRHRETNGERVPVLAEDAPVAAAKELAMRCRHQGLEPIMMFSTIYPEHPRAMEVLTRRVEQAETAGIGQVLTFGHTQGDNRRIWIERLKALGPIAKDHGVMIVIKQHGGTTGSGAACAEIVAEVDHPSIAVNYDAGNVMDYLNLDPIPDIRQCAESIRSFCIKDHRNWPKDEDCGPGFGEIDHYQLLSTVAHSGLTIPLAYENIFPPLLPRPTSPEVVDNLARRAREYIETVIAGLHASPPLP